MIDVLLALQPDRYDDDVAHHGHNIAVARHSVLNRRQLSVNFAVPGARRG
jgi:hypothetical protein